jgi:hypothetical protein
MHDDTVTTSWRRLTDKLRGLRSETVEDAFAGTSRDLPQTATATAACRTDRDGEATQQARLATWEDEGGTTSS